jgi:hypothetical protein
VSTTPRGAPLQNDYARTEERIKCGDEWLAAAAAFDNTNLLIGIACGDEVQISLMQFSVFTREIVMKITNWNADALTNGLGNFATKMQMVTEVLRKKLVGAEQILRSRST